MSFKFIKVAMLAICILFFCFMIPTTLGDNYERTYNFQAQYALIGQKMDVSIQPSLYNYYSNASHVVNCDANFSRFVTPQTVKPIADSLRKATNDLPNSDEQFADAVLMLVHQIPYRIEGTKYPVETIVDNSGDCVGLSLLAASIMQAGGLDVVLIHYTGVNPSHINVGLYLPYAPIYHNILTSPTSFEYNNKTYWTGEATPESDWKIGDQSDLLVYANAEIIPLNDTEQSSPGQVASSLGTQLLPSFITVNLSQAPPSIQNITRAFNISGSISQPIEDQYVTVYISQGTSYPNCSQTITDSSGNYALTWSFNETGTYYITTSWSGTPFYAGADSEKLTVFVGPESVLQFQAPNYNYILEQTNILYYLFGAASTANNTLRPIQGVNNFLSIPIGTNISFSYNFIVLQTGHPASNYSSQTITTPPHEQQMRIGRNRQIRTVQVPGQTLTVPTNVPDGMGPLTLPPDFNQTINNQFCFLLQNNGSDNYSLNMKALDGYDVANMTQDNQSNMAFVNASGVIKENTWYKITEGISENEITARINDANGTLIGRMITPSDAVAILVANNVDNAVIFKNLQFQNVNTPTQTPEPNAKVTSSISLFSSYVVVAVVLLVTISVAMLYFKSKRASDKDSGKLPILS